MEIAHCSEPTMNTQMTRKLYMLGPKAYCRLGPHARVISPEFDLLLVSPLGLSSFTHALLQPGTAALLPIPQGLMPAPVLTAVLRRFPQRQNKLHLEGPPAPQ